jgi:hypothetical protein
MVGHCCILWIAASCDAATNDIAISHHPDQPIVLTNRDRTDVVFLHQSRELFDRRIGINPRRAFVHCLLNFHGRHLSRAAPSIVQSYVVKRAWYSAFPHE